MKQYQISRSNPQSIPYRLLFNMLLSLQVRIRYVAIRYLLIRGSLYNAILPALLRKQSLVCLFYYIVYDYL